VKRFKPTRPNLGTDIDYTRNRTVLLVDDTATAKWEEKPSAITPSRLLRRRCCKRLQLKV